MTRQQIVRRVRKACVTRERLEQFVEKMETISKALEHSEKYKGYWVDPYSVDESSHAFQVVNRYEGAILAAQNILNP